LCSTVRDRCGDDVSDKIDVELKCPLWQNVKQQQQQPDILGVSVFSYRSDSDKCQTCRSFAITVSQLKISDFSREKIKVCKFNIHGSVHRSMNQ